jgi:HD-GYP domain-containing protein (c-di-GMP phosphodiesterase class II)
VVLACDLDAVNGQATRGEETGRVNLLQKKLAGLDTRFKDLFLHAVEEIMEILEHRDPYMADHAMKVQHYALLIAKEMELPHRLLKRIQVAAMLHDIGMVAMPDSIVLNSGPLNEEQLEIMKRHPLLSVRIMEGMEFLEQEIPAVRYHHERFDGRGYPEGLKGPAIPLTARIIAVADAFNAMTTPRTFRPAKSRTEAMEELHRASGLQFDPTVVEAFESAATNMGEQLMSPPEQGVDTSESAPASDREPAGTSIGG